MRHSCRARPTASRSSPRSTSRPAITSTTPANADGGTSPDYAGAAVADMGAAAGNRDPSAGALFVFRGPTLLRASVVVAADGEPAALAAFGDTLGSGYGSHLAVGY